MNRLDKTLDSIGLKTYPNVCNILEDIASYPTAFLEFNEYMIYDISSGSVSFKKFEFLLLLQRKEEVKFI